MRYWRQIALVVGVSLAYGVVARALAGPLPPPTTTPQVPPSLVLLGLAGVALSLVLYGWLGRHVVRSGGSAGAAAGAGAVAGLIGGAIGFLQGLANVDEAVALLPSVGIPEEAIRALAIASAAVAGLVGAGLSALVTWIAAILFRPRQGDAEVV